MATKERSPPASNDGKDEKLRRYGWVIHERPEVGPTLWKRAGIVRTEVSALAHCREELERVGKSKSGG